MFMDSTVTVMAGSVATAEAKTLSRSERTVKGIYDPDSGPVGFNELPGKFACLVLPTHPNERFFTAKVTDAHGKPVFVEVTTTGSAAFARFCGETTKPIAFDPGAELRFHVASHQAWRTAQCDAHRLTTTGSISVTISNEA